MGEGEGGLPDLKKARTQSGERVTVKGARMRFVAVPVAFMLTSRTRMRRVSDFTVPSGTGCGAFILPDLTCGNECTPNGKVYMTRRQRRRAK